LPNIIGRFKPRNMRWAGHVACTGGGREKFTWNFGGEI